MAPGFGVRWGRTAPPAPPFWEEPDGRRAGEDAAPQPLNAEGRLSRLRQPGGDGQALALRHVRQVPRWQWRRPAAGTSPRPTVEDAGVGSTRLRTAAGQDLDVAVGTMHADPLSV